ncbi:MAG: DNA repair protein RecO [Gammaproteobacteria bacterium]
MRAALHPCYILHLRPYRETSLIAEVFSRDYGRVGLVAKGARRSRQRSVHQPLRRLNIAWVMRGELGTLTQIEAAGAVPVLNGRGLIAALYLNELVMRLLHRHESHPELFDAYDGALTAMSSAGDDEAILRVFEKRLLVSLGYGIVLDHDVSTGAPVQNELQYYYVTQKGPCIEADPSPGTIRISGETLTALAQEKFTQRGQLTEAKRLMRLVLSEHLGLKPLASREIYRQFLRHRQRA